MILGSCLYTRRKTSVPILSLSALQRRIDLPISQKLLFQATVRTSLHPSNPEPSPLPLPSSTTSSTLSSVALDIDWTARRRSPATKTTGSTLCPSAVLLRRSVERNTGEKHMPTSLPLTFRGMWLTCTAAVDTLTQELVWN